MSDSKKPDEVDATESTLKVDFRDAFRGAEDAAAPFPIPRSDAREPSPLPPPVTPPWAEHVVPAPAPSDALDETLVPVLPLDPASPAPPSRRMVSGDERIPSRTTENLPVLNATRFPAFTLPWSVRPPKPSRTVVVKGTFDIQPGGAATPAVDQALPSGDLPTDAVPGCLAYASDFAVFKPKADITLVGHAYPPRPGARVSTARFAFGTAFDRRIAVFGDRTWDRLGAQTQPAPFERVPLRWDHAFGGPKVAENPAGKSLPNIEDPDALVSARGDRGRPACFAPLPPAWSPRNERLGTYDARWLETRWPWLPADFDWSHFNAAPPEQRIAYPEGDEPFRLMGMHPEQRILAGRLPGWRPRGFIQRTQDAGGAFLEVRLRLDTVHFDVDAMTVTLVWRGVLEVEDEDASELATVFVTEDGATPLRLEDARQQMHGMLRESSRDGDGMEGSEDVEDEATADLEAVALPVPTRQAVLELIAKDELVGIDLTGADLTGLDLSGRDLTGAILDRAAMTSTDLRGARLVGASLVDVSAEGANFEGADLEDADLTGASLAGASFAAAAIRGTCFERANLDRTRLEGADGAGATFADASMVTASLVEARLDGADLTAARMDGADFTRATLNDAKLYGARGVGVRLDDASAKDLRADDACLPQLSARGLRADGSAWEGADLTNARMEEATLRDATFVRTCLRGARLVAADCRAARFRKAVVDGASFEGANLMAATTERAGFSRSSLRDANVYASDLARSTSR